jgi:predicted RNase H-like nuclease (RuvC/YqgF family)
MNDERITVAENYVDDRGDSDLEKQISTLKARVKDLEEINEGHRMLNAELRKEIFTWKKSASELEKAKNLLQGYKKVIQDLSTKLSRKDS